LACQEEFFVNNPLDAKENNEHALDFTLHLPHLSRSALNQANHSNTHLQLMLSSMNTCLIIAMVCFYCTLSMICTKSEAHSLLDPSRNCIMPDAQFQIKGHKNPVHPHSCIKYVH
jgi:hypothetical protein